MTKQEITEEVKQQTLNELNSEEVLTNVEDSGQLVTRVTSIANEEKLTGQKVEVPNEEQLVANASLTIFRTRKELHHKFAVMSKKAMLRAVAAIFSLPEDGLPVLLKTKEEQEAYSLAQRHMMARFTVIQKAILDERRAVQQKALDALKTVSEDNQPTNTEETVDG